MSDSATIPQYILSTLAVLAKDLGYGGEINSETRLFADLGFESLDLVILGTSIQEHYQRKMRFAELMADLGQRQTPDLTAGELITFVETELASS